MTSAVNGTKGDEMNQYRTQRACAFVNEYKGRPRTVFLMRCSVFQPLLPRHAEHLRYKMGVNLIKSAHRVSHPADAHLTLAEVLR